MPAHDVTAPLSVTRQTGDSHALTLTPIRRRARTRLPMNRSPRALERARRRSQGEQDSTRRASTLLGTAAGAARAAVTHAYPRPTAPLRQHPVGWAAVTGRGAPRRPVERAYASLRPALARWHR